MNDKTMSNMSSMNHSHMSGMSHMGNLKRKFIISLVLAIPIIILSPMMGITLPFQLTFPGSQWIVLALSTILFFYGGMPFLSGAKEELHKKNPAMMTLISLGITTAYVYSLYAFIMNTFFSGGEHIMDFFWELATLIVIMLLGHWIEMKAVSGAGDALEKMAQLLPSSASVRQSDGSFKDVDLHELKSDDIIRVKSGEKVAADGIITEGSTSVNESMVTGEARDVTKHQGDKVIGGSQNGSGSILVKITGTGESGYLAQVMNLVKSAQQEKSDAETLSDKVARWLFFAALTAGIITIIVWFIVSEDLSTAVTRMVTVLVIACPHALGLAIPLVIARSTSLGAKNGLLVRKRQALEIVPKADVLMMDKTGTLTEGDFKVTEILSFEEGLSENDVLKIMLGLEEGSSHPLAAGIKNEARKQNVHPANVSNIKNIPGVGIEGILDNKKKVKIATSAYLENKNISYDETSYNNLAEKGYTVSFLLLEDDVVGLIAQGDEIKPDGRSFIKDLKSYGISPVMLTGDNEKAASKIAGMLGINSFSADLLPEEKEKIIRERQTEGNKVMMVGDGINDAPALARADVGVAIGAGTDVAIDSADVVLVKSDPKDILHLIKLAKNTTRKMIQNLWWGAGYNIIAIPLAAGVLAPIGIILSPAVGAILMSLSTIIVAANAVTLNIK